MRVTVHSTASIVHVIIHSNKLGGQCFFFILMSPILLNFALLIGQRQADTIIITGSDPTIDPD